MAYNWQTRVDDPIVHITTGYDPVQSYMDSYFTPASVSAKRTTPGTYWRSWWSSKHTVAGLTGTGLGYYAVNNNPWIGSAATAYLQPHN